MTLEEKIKILKQRPSVHQLCYGLFIQEPIFFSDLLFAFPLSSLGFTSHTEYLIKYTSLIDSLFGVNEANQMINQGQSANPVVVLVYLCAKDNHPENMEKCAESQLIHARRILSWISGDEITPFAFLINRVEDIQHSLIKQILPFSQYRNRLRFGNIGDDFNPLIKKIYSTANNDEHFSYALTLFHDALREENPKFKVARLFNVLECLAYKIKKTESATRKAVKILIGLPEGATISLILNEENYEFDIIEISGRLRDKLFHGSVLREEDLNKKSRNTFSIIENNPEIIIDGMLSYCENEIARWANGTSIGLSYLSNNLKETKI